MITERECDSWRSLDFRLEREPGSIF